MITKSKESYTGTNSGQPLRMTVSDLNNKMDASYEEGYNYGYDDALNDVMEDVEKESVLVPMLYKIKEIVNNLMEYDDFDVQENKWKEKCDESALKYKSGEIHFEDHEDAVLYHPLTLEDAIFIREYMEKTYPEIDIAILVKGFMYYSKTMKNISKEWYE